MKFPIRGLPKLPTIIIFVFLLVFLHSPRTISDEYFFPTIEFESAFAEDEELPLEWIEVMVFSKNPNTMEFFEGPVISSLLPKERNETTDHYEARNELPLKLRIADLPSEKIWILYRIDQDSATSEGFQNPYMRILYDRYSTSAWLFELPLLTDIDRMSIDSDRLAYSLVDSQESSQIEGTPFHASYFPQRAGRKRGGGAYLRSDRLTRFKELADHLNKDLPETLELRTAGKAVWQGSISLCRAYGEGTLGPGEIDKPVVTRGYIPIFVIIRDSLEDVILPQEKPWFIAPTAKEGTRRYDTELRVPVPKEKVLYTDLRHEDPVLWEELPLDAKERYKIPERIEAGKEAKLIVFWRKPAEEYEPFPNIFFIYLRQPTGEDFRTIVFKREEATAAD